MACLVRSPPQSLSIVAPRGRLAVAPLSSSVRCSYPAASGGSKGENADDVNATLRALNSAGSRHFARKSLGQVCPMV